MNKARRAKVIDMDAVRDDGFTSEIPNFFGSADHFLDAVRGSARLLRLDRQAGQTRRLALWCEASGMVPQLQRIADPFGIGVYSSGGFDSEGACAAAVRAASAAARAASAAARASALRLRCASSSARMFAGSTS